MKYDYGVGVRLVFSNNPRVASILKDSQDVYDILESNGIEHYDAEDAACWTEMAYVDEYYERDDFIIEMVEVL